MIDNYVIYLGGSITHSVNFEYLKKKKYKIILIDQNPNCYCRKYSDFFINLSQTETKKILLNLKKFFYNKKFSVIDCFGTAHYSYPAINKIKLKYLKNSVNDTFLMHKYEQKKKLKNSNLIPEYILLPNFEKIRNNKRYYLNKIFKFCESKDFNLHVKSDGKHQGEGIIKIDEKLSKLKFEKKYFKLILDLYKKTKRVYIEETIDGKLLNIDFIKKENGDVMFLPLILRDRVILDGKKKFLSVFQYLDNSRIISENFYVEFKKIIIKLYKNIAIFGTIDAKVYKNYCKILEISPHFHNSKIHKFLNNNDLLDIYLNKNHHKKIKKFQKTNTGGYIFVHGKNNYTKKMENYVKKKSEKILIDNIDISKRKTFLKKNGFIKDDFYLIYFKVKSKKNLKLITSYLEQNKKNIY